MTPEQKRRLQMFVDRKGEVRKFRELLEAEDKCAMVVWGESGIGKSALMARLVKECADREVPCTQVVWGRIKNYDTVALMKKIARQLGEERFERFLRLLAQIEETPEYLVRVAGETNLFQGASLDDAEIGTAAAVNIENLHLPRSTGISREQLLALTEDFVSDLAQLLVEEPLVVFLDHTERMASETQDWIAEGLLGGFAKGELKNIKVIQFGRKPPNFMESTDLGWLVEEAELGPLAREDIVEYLEKREVQPEVREALADMVAANTDCSAHQVAKFVESFLEFQQNRESDATMSDDEGSERTN